MKGQNSRYIACLTEVDFCFSVRLRDIDFSRYVLKADVEEQVDNKPKRYTASIKADRAEPDPVTYNIDCVI